jgi:DNA-binding transcriptional ArsR family regulator
VSLSVGSPATAEVVLQEPPLARTKLWTELVYQLDREGELAEIVADVLDGLDAGDARERLQELDVDDEYTTATLKAARHGDDPAIWGRFVRETAFQGRGGTALSGDARSLDDLKTSALPLFANADGLTVGLTLPDQWRGREAVQRRRWLSFVAELSGSMDVVLELSRVERTRLLERHEDDLPATFVNNLRQTAPTGSDGVARVASRVGEAEARRVLHALREAPQEALSMDELQSSLYCRDVGRSANAHRVSQLVEHDLVDRREVDGERHVVLLPRGARVLDVLDESDVSPPSVSAGSNAVSADGGLDTTAGSSSDGGSGEVGAAVNNPPNPSAGPCTPAWTREGEAPDSDRPAPDRPSADRDETAEAAALDEDDDPPRQTDGWGPLWWHHAVDAVTGSEQLSLVDEPLSGDLPDRAVSLDRDRDVAVVGIEANSTIAWTASRLAAALTDDRLLNSVLTAERVGDDLEELALDDPVVRRLGAQLGWHGETDEHRGAFRDRLRAAGSELLSDAGAVGSGSGFDSDLASDVLRRAHGLIGTVVRLLDLAGIETRIELRTDWREWSNHGLDALREFIGQATAISTVHGAYPLYRSMYEQRETKREISLGAPTVDDGRGESLASWCLRGPGASRSRMLRHLDHLDLDLNPVDDDAPNYAEFYADLDVEVADRDAVATVATRLLEYKSLSETQESVTLLYGLAAGPFAAAKALYGLGSESRRPSRDLRVDEVRTALSQLDPAQLVPDLDRRSNSRAAGSLLSVLLRTEKDLSLRKLAEAADVSKQTARNRVVELEALGLLEREDLGAGRATLHRLGFAGGVDEDDRHLPELVDDAHMSHTDGAQLVLARLTDHEFSPILDAPEAWDRLVEGSGSIHELIPADRPGWSALLDVALRLVDDGPDSRLPSPASESFRIGKRPDIGQISLV